MGGILSEVEGILGVGGGSGASSSDIGGALGNAYASGRPDVKHMAMGAQSQGLGASQQMSLPELMQMLQPRMEGMESQRVDRGASNPFLQFMLRGQQ